MALSTVTVTVRRGAWYLALFPVILAQLYFALIWRLFLQYVPNPVFLVSFYLHEHHALQFQFSLLFTIGANCLTCFSPRYCSIRSLIAGVIIAVPATSTPCSSFILLRI
ncbi:hypothetical protein L228DRAFT_161960 [Xylona heveae TC161]|uniref:Uncharacterized protein n=1 Tax=Xylona heveae (strain CBS 132557 / TC161) TaxID=1328760 RepID=A0A165G8I6_XYLHT|nr:hypothetical protein L228DRAFT_161960 [Xylona heveae TC161]KZF21868.1 hypothetical protein L228DRAFT_161960 [Xylona heveae TC161]